MQVFRLPYQAKSMFDLCNYHEDKINIAAYDHSGCEKNVPVSDMFTVTSVFPALTPLIEVVSF